MNSQRNRLRPIDTQEYDHILQDKEQANLAPIEQPVEPPKLVGVWYYRWQHQPHQWHEIPVTSAFTCWGLIQTRLEVLLRLTSGQCRNKEKYMVYGARDNQASATKWHACESEIQGYLEQQENVVMRILHGKHKPQWLQPTDFLNPQATVKLVLCRQPVTKSMRAGVTLRRIFYHETGATSGFWVHCDSFQPLKNKRLTWSEFQNGPPELYSCLRCQGRLGHHWHFCCPLLDLSAEEAKEPNLPLKPTKQTGRPENWLAPTLVTFDNPVEGDDVEMDEVASVGPENSVDPEEVDSAANRWAHHCKALEAKDKYDPWLELMQV